jgi:hypothetical protein
MCSDKKEEYKQELVKSFHQQFAENQNNHQSTFIQLLSIIITVIVGFGFGIRAHTMKECLMRFLAHKILQ